MYWTYVFIRMHFIYPEARTNAWTQLTKQHDTRLKQLKQKVIKSFCYSKRREGRTRAWATGQTHSLNNKLNLDFTNKNEIIWWWSIIFLQSASETETVAQLHSTRLNACLNLDHLICNYFSGFLWIYNVNPYYFTIIAYHHHYYNDDEIDYSLSTYISTWTFHNQRLPHYCWRKTGEDTDFSDSGSGLTLIVL